METINQKSLKLNMVLNAIKGLMAIIFPLISFPYVSRVLGVETLGKYNFAISIISYFILLSGLGINTYAIREGARCRDDKEKLNKFANQVFSINIIATIISYILLFILLIVVSKFHEYTTLLIILSLQIMFKTIGIEWLYSAYEDYVYITVRSIIFQLLSLILLFACVHSTNDIYIYAIISVLSSVGSNILNFINSRKYCKISVTKNINLKKHIKPILILFATTITISIYVNSDITILGFMTNDYHVGIYSVSTKIYSIIKSLLASIVIVSIPRFSSLVAQNKISKLKKIAEDVYKTLLTFVTPAIVGIIVLRKEIVLIISDDTYLAATSSLVWLSIAMFVCLGAYFWGQAMLVPLKQEKKVLKITIISAIVNIVLNMILIPFFKENAAAVTTIIAETIAFIYCKYETKKIIKLNSFSKIFIKTILGSTLIFIIDFIVRKNVTNVIILSTSVVILSIIFYIILEIILQNEIILKYLEEIKKKINKFRNI